MVTDEPETGNEEELDLSSGMVPHHNLGPVTGFDHDSGLPIVKRKTADAPEAKQEPKPDKPAPEPEKPKAETQPDAKPTLAKGAPVQLPDGSSGKIVFYHAGTDIARVRGDDGKNVRSVRGKALKILPHIQVAAHVRRIPQ